MAPSFISLLVMFFPAAMSIAAVDDMRRMRISNWIPISLLCVFPCAAFFTNLGLQEAFLYHGAFAVLVLSIGFVLFCFKVMGGGDAKLIMAVALWLGWSEAFLWFLLISSVIGGLMGLFFLLLRWNWLPLYLRNHPLLSGMTTSGKIPFGVALAAGALMVYPSSRWFAIFVIP